MSDETAAATATENSYAKIASTTLLVLGIVHAGSGLVSLVFEWKFLHIAGFSGHSIIFGALCLAGVHPVRVWRFAKSILWFVFFAALVDMVISANVSLDVDSSGYPAFACVLVRLYIMKDIIIHPVKKALTL